MLKISLDSTSEPGVPESHVVTEQTPIKQFVEIEGVPYSEAEDDVKATLKFPLSLELLNRPIREESGLQQSFGNKGAREKIR